MRTRAALAALLLASCLDVPEGPAPECRATTECDSANGEVCEEGVCWGNPPEGMFAAVVVPPSDRKDLVPKEIRELQITESGWIAGLALERPITVSGAVEATCPGTGACDRAIEATITVTRASHFAGGPGFKTVIETTVSTDGATYELRVPPPRADATDEERRELPYTVTVVPKGRGDSEPTSPTAAMRVPPMWFQIAPTEDTTRAIQLGGTALGAIDGQVLSSAFAGLAKYRVVALGRWEPGGPLTEVSTVAYTQADGKFTLYLSDGLAEDVEVVARPYGGGIQPTLRMAGVSKDGATQLALVEPIGLGGTEDIGLELRGKNGDGEIGPVRGATVRLSAQVGAPTPGATRATVTFERTTDDSGRVKVPVLGGSAINDAYVLDVIPPASAAVGAITSVPLGPMTSRQTILLPPRVAIRGTVVGAWGEPLENVPVTARPALEFLWSLEGSAQTFLSSIPVATTSTTSRGEFVLWVDPLVASVGGLYDVVIEPPTTNKYPLRAPTHVVTDIAIPDRSGPPLLEIVLPDAAFVHGQVTDPSNKNVEGAEVKVFKIIPSLTSICTSVPHAPSTCPVPASLQGRGASDLGGVVRVTLPR